ncbi:hypothetical protein FHT40_005394 [Mycolicibacterium sp. BK556]|uniref:CPBP family intramembrane glutamic endopeptidase n=1 Tax=unclassified Mycolicibacterium TaxID=2636767 RepID=UPI00160FFF8E|nr:MULTISPECIES: CPBP family intramembrane glutamic endopeptidase [unclassified Mycolicibacterium]MBB3605707.1 hypothetical protein [Mycolicibacterium sp. BK556]MBB3635796.1 hypothetical protein [Mycolicibacterium sp. BK607]
MTTLAEIRAVVTNNAVPQSEWPSVIRRRRIIVCVVLVVGAVLLGLSLSRTPGDTAFYWLTFALAAAWGFGSLLSGPLHLGCIRWRGRNQRPVLTGITIGLLLGGVFVVGGFVVREIGPVAQLISRVLEYANHGSLTLVVIITLVNGFAEELFFRGALYSALGAFHPVLISTLLYIVATCASGNPMLGFAAIILGTVNAWQRRATGGVLAPVLTHVVWGLIMVLALPPMFGVST